MTPNSILRAILNVRETRRTYLNLKAECDQYRRQGMAPRQYEQELKALNDAKALFFQSVQRLLDEADEEIERQKHSPGALSTDDQYIKGEEL